MKKIILTGLVATSLGASAQLSVGNAESLTVPTGAVLSYEALAFTPAADLTISANTIFYTATPIPAFASAAGVNRVYTFTSPLLYTGTMNIAYADAELNGNLEGALAFYYRNSGMWHEVTTSAVNTVINLVTANFSNQSFDGFTLAQGGTVLPLVANSFSGTWLTPYPKLSWSVWENERYSAFNLERYANSNWQLVQVINGTNAAGTCKYEAVDKHDGENERIYRLKLLQKDGRVVYSTAVLLQQKSPSSVSIQPMPGGAVFNFSNVPQHAEVFSSMGQLIWKSTSVSGTYQVSGLAKGIYFLRYGFENRQEQKSFSVYR